MHHEVTIWQCMFPWQLARLHHVFMWLRRKVLWQWNLQWGAMQTGVGPMTMYFMKWDCKIRPRESVIQCSSNSVKLWTDDTIKQSRNDFLLRYNLIILQSILVLAFGFRSNVYFLLLQSGNWSYLILEMCYKEWQKISIFIQHRHQDILSFVWYQFCPTLPL